MSGIKGYSSWPSVRLPIDIVRIAVTGAWTLAKATAFVYGEVVTVTPMASSVGGGGGGGGVGLAAPAGPAPGAVRRRKKRVF